MDTKDYVQPNNLSAQDAQGDLFRSRPDQIISNGHPLFQLARQINWSFFDTEFGGQVTGSGVVARSCRRHLELVVGLLTSAGSRQWHQSPQENQGVPMRAQR